MNVNYRYELNVAFWTVFILIGGFHFNILCKYFAKALFHLIIILLICFCSKLWFWQVLDDNFSPNYCIMWRS